jgi:DNA-binding winged helix-turn-helix (wHTH) protein
MDGLGSDEILVFGGFRFDGRIGALSRLDQAGSALPIPLGARALHLLTLLIGRPGELVLKDEIMAAVWPGRVVEDGNLNVQISKLRHILDQDRREGSCIQTVTGFGYRFTADITRLGTSALLETHPPSKNTGEAGGATPKFKDSCGPVAAAEGCSVPAPSTNRTRGVVGRGVISLLIGGLGLLVVLIAATGWHSSQPANLKPPPLSIVVLPFANLLPMA